MSHTFLHSRLFLLSLLAHGALFEANLWAGAPRGKVIPGMAKIAAGPSRGSALTINSFVSWLHADGISNQNADMQGPGGLWPNVFESRSQYADGTITGGAFRGRSMVYADGILWGGKPYRDPAYTVPVALDTLRVGGQSYSSGTQPGWISGTGASAVPVDRNDVRARVYRIRRDYATQSYNYGVFQTEAAILFHEGDLGAVTSADEDSIRHMYQRDWIEWPVDLGAPYIERNGQPGYQPPPPLQQNGFSEDDLIAQHYDEPGIAGPSGSAPAAQVVWTVYNDLGPAVTDYFGCAPLGLEIQCVMWGYRHSNAIYNIYFRRYRIINKGGVDLGSGLRGSLYIDSMYVGQWSDPDIGAVLNDLCGCDPIQNIGLAYNGTGADAEFQAEGLAPPAVAYDLLQGPIVPGAPGDSATANFKRVYGKRNLPLTSFLPLGQQEFIEDPFGPRPTRWYRALRGYLQWPEKDTRFPSGPYPESPFPMSGDPVTGQGFVDGLGTTYSPEPGDRRFVMGSGPFRLAPGDTQEVIIATVIGSGADNLSSVSVMRFNDRYAKSAHSLLYEVPIPPAQPRLKVTALNGEIVLEWGSDPAAVDATEKALISGSYRFEGYTVYQLPPAGSTVGGRVRIATFDEANDVARVVIEGISPSTGLPEYTVAQEGSNSGIRRHLIITEDRSGQITEPYARPVPLRNGQEYRFAVTAYNYTKDVTRLPRSLESNETVVAITPAIPFGAQYSGQPGDSLTLKQSKGWSDQPPGVYVVDPTATTDHEYRLSFVESGDSLAMSWYNTSRGITAWTGPLVMGNDGPIVDGVMARLVVRNIGMRGYSIPSGTRRWAMSGGSIGLGLEGFSGAMGYARAIFPGTTATPGSLRDVLLVLAATDTLGLPLIPGDPNVSYAYRYLENSSRPPARPEFSPHITRSSILPWAYQGFDRSLPLAAFDLRTETPTRLVVGHLENNVDSGLVDGRYWPGVNTSNTSPGSAREWFVVFDRPYRETPDTLLARDLSPSARIPAMWLCTAARRQAVGFGAADQFLIQSFHALSAADTFRFTSPAVDRSRAAQEASASRVGVFPNPYVCGSFFNGAHQGTFVTFNNLPVRATLRIFNLAGQLVRTLHKDDPSQFLRWDLANDRAILVGSGMYIVHVDMPDIGATKILKLAVIQEVNIRRGY